MAYNKERTHAYFRIRQFKNLCFIKMWSPSPNTMLNKMWSASVNTRPLKTKAVEGLTKLCNKFDGKFHFIKCYWPTRKKVEITKFLVECSDGQFSPRRKKPWANVQNRNIEKLWRRPTQLVIHSRGRNRADQTELQKQISKCSFRR